MTPRSTSFALAVLAAALSACSGSRRAAPTPLSPDMLEALKPLPALQPLEPLACALHASQGRPELAAEDVACVLKYLRAAEGYLAQGGKPSQHTNAKTLEWWRKTAQGLNAQVAASLSAKHAAAAKPAAPPEPPVAGKEDVSRESEQHYLSGIIFFQKGDYLKAGEEWRLALQASPANGDAKAGLDRLRKMGVER